MHYPACLSPSLAGDKASTAPLSLSLKKNDPRQEQQICLPKNASNWRREFFFLTALEVSNKAHLPMEGVITHVVKCVEEALDHI